MSSSAACWLRTEGHHAAARFDAILVDGWQSPLLTFKGALNLQKKFVEFYEAGRIFEPSVIFSLEVENGRISIWTVRS